MKFFAYNDKLYSTNEFGSFTVVARKLNDQFQKMDCLGDISNNETFVIYPEVFDTQQRWNKQIPFLACEYSYAPDIVIQKLKHYNPLVLAISDFAKNNICRSGYSNIQSVHLGSDVDFWKSTYVKKNKTFTYLTVNSSNDRSGYEKLIPAYLKFSKNKDTLLIIKDGHNPEFKSYINSLSSDKIQYIDSMLSETELRDLYNSSHIFLYANNTTSFGMNPMDSVLCGTPCITTMGSALKEFIPEWTQPKKINTTLEPITVDSIREWTRIGIRCFPESFLSLFQKQPYAERVIQEDILEALEYSFTHYDQYLDIVPKYQEYIKNNFTWEICAKNIIQKVLNYDKSISR